MRSRLLVLTCLAALILAACSGGDDDSSTRATPDRSSSTTSAGVNGPVKLEHSSPGCQKNEVMPSGEAKITMTSGGKQRWYFRHIPPVPNEPSPVVLDLHGYSEGATVHEMMSNLGAFGDANGFITITPQGQGKVARWDTKLDSADMQFIGDLLDEVEQDLCVDQNRIYVTGLSNGAFMTSAVACKYADRIAAAAPVAGIRDIAGCKPSRPVPVIAFHGTGDTFVAYDGGPGSSVANLPAPDGSGKTLGEEGLDSGQPKGPTIPEITADWAKRNGCRTKRTETTVTADVDLITFSCPKGAEAELYRVNGGGHSWPGSAFSQQVGSVVGPTTMSISANELMWKFFQEHPLS
jgi:polyhydroxybutyrate depolymerase